ncbi:uncharacterized protein CLUP02_16348 [Colletotrichum lupini]|uniref:Uncharacterized protein n=1 Tax=Colletotrichum lupini TaxID=145971 RepID=A0A9Q8WPK4_9PEZI|nr:uncharacterized protein CLUP02_16348 [Colletotrichum lupini]UQC90816.1 hypothetical protein CLUP02_16348 [Colletotrichum lupini]
MASQAHPNGRCRLSPGCGAKTRDTPESPVSIRHDARHFLRLQKHDTLLRLHIKSKVDIEQWVGHQTIYLSRLKVGEQWKTKLEPLKTLFIVKTRESHGKNKRTARSNHSRLCCDSPILCQDLEIEATVSDSGLIVGHFHVTYVQTRNRTYAWWNWTLRAYMLFTVFPINQSSKSYIQLKLRGGHPKLQVRGRTNFVGGSCVLYRNAGDAGTSLSEAGPAGDGLAIAESLGPARKATSPPNYLSPMLSAIAHRPSIAEATTLERNAPRHLTRTSSNARCQLPAPRPPILGALVTVNARQAVKDKGQGRWDRVPKAWLQKFSPGGRGRGPLTILLNVDPLLTRTPYSMSSDRARARPFANAASRSLMKQSLRDRYFSLDSPSESLNVTSRSQSAPRRVLLSPRRCFPPTDSNIRH